MSPNEHDHLPYSQSAIYQKIQRLNNQIDEYNRQLTISGDTSNQRYLIDELKTLHKELNRLNIKLLPKAYRTGKQ